ncbi:MAG: hypothetical protein ABSB30_14645 [Terracidiphilus sp.]|jgi:hypothetical protein
MQQKQVAMLNGLPRGRPFGVDEKKVMADTLCEAEYIREEEVMRIIDILEAQTNLEKLIDELKPGEWFAISVDGKPKVKVIALTPEEFRQLSLEEK